MALNLVPLVLDLYDGGGNLIASGTASLTPTSSLVDATDNVYVAQSPLVANFRVGASPLVEILPTDNMNIEPNGWAWQISFDNVPGDPPSYDFAIPGTGYVYSYTATFASPAVFTAAGSSLGNGTPVVLAGSTSTLLGAFWPNTIYYVVDASGATFSLAASVGGSAIASTSSGSGEVAVVQFLSSLTMIDDVQTVIPIPVSAGGTGSITQNWQGLLTPVSVTQSSGTYSASAGSLVKANIAGGSWTLSLPNAPATSTVVGAKLMANATGNANTLTVQCNTAGSDRFEQSGGSTTSALSLTMQAAIWQYNGGYWTRISDDLPLGQLNTVYGQLAAANTWTANNLFDSGKPWFDVDAYGADSSGVNDSTLAFNKAIASALGGQYYNDLGYSATSKTVSNPSAQSSDLNQYINSSNFPGGYAQITAVTPSSSYTVSVAATSTLSAQSAFVGYRQVAQGQYAKGIVRMSAGTYKISSDIIIRSVLGFQLVGAGVTSTNIMASGSGFTNAPLYINGSLDGYFANFELTGNGTEMAGASYLPNALLLTWDDGVTAARSTSANTFENIRIRNMNFVNGLTQAATGGPYQVDGSTLQNIVVAGGYSLGAWSNTGRWQSGFVFGNGDYGNEYDYALYNCGTSGCYYGYSCLASGFTLNGGQPGANYCDFYIDGLGGEVSVVGLQSQNSVMLVNSVGGSSVGTVAFRDIIWKGYSSEAPANNYWIEITGGGAGWEFSNITNTVPPASGGGWTPVVRLNGNGAYISATFTDFHQANSLTSGFSIASAGAAYTNVVAINYIDLNSTGAQVQQLYPFNVYSNGGWNTLPDNVFSPLTFGAVGNGTTDDTTAVLAAFTAAFGVNGVVELGTNTFLTSQPIPIAGPTNGIRVRGSLYFGGGAIQNRTTDVFQVTGSAQHMVFENCNFSSLSGGGHIFNCATTGNVSTGPSMSFWRFIGCNILQNNTGKAIWYQVGGAFIDCLYDQNCYLQCASGATVSPMSFLAIPGALNSVQFKRMRCVALGATVPFFDIDPGWGAHRDTNVGFTASSATVTDTSATATDLGMFIYSSNLPNGSATITAVTPGTGYTVNENATSNLSGQTCLIGVEGWDEEISWESVTFELCAGGGISATGCINVLISECSDWDIPSSRSDTGCGTTNTSKTVTDASAVVGDLGSVIAGTGIPAGTYITAVAAGTGYTISQAATANGSGLTFTVGGLAANFYSFTKSTTGYACSNIQLHGCRAGAGSTAGTAFYDFYADSNSTNILIDSFGSWGTAPIVSYPAQQTTLINLATGSASISPAITTPLVSALGTTGATAASRYAGATASGAPASGTFAVGDFVIDQTARIWVCTTAGTVGSGCAFMPIGSGGLGDYYQTTHGTYSWTSPVGATWLEMYLCCAGGGGGSGRRGTSSNIACGGGGGGSGDTTYFARRTADLPSLSLTITVGAGGAGGAAVTTDSTSGITGTGGGQTFIRDSNSYYIATTYVSGGGGGGTTSAGASGFAEANAFGAVAVAGSAASTTGGAGVTSNVSWGPGAGSSGGGISGATPTASLGGTGIWMLGGSYSQAAAYSNGAIDTTQPSVSWTQHYRGEVGPGSPGGWSSVTGVAAAGCNGVLGSGGGGGGASLNGSNSGAGGAGADGFVWIIPHFD